MKKLTLALCIISLAFAMCEKKTDNDNITDFSLLNGNNFILTVNRVSMATNVQLPSDNLQEDDYIHTDELIQYDITFSENGDIVTIEPGSIQGNTVNDSKTSKRYELVKGVFAGGRFVIWKDNGNFEVEHTIYGSGLPILKSERGKLELVTE